MHRFIELANKVKHKQIASTLKARELVYGTPLAEDCLYHNKELATGCPHCTPQKCPVCNLVYKNDTICPGCLYDESLAGQSKIFRKKIPRVYHDKNQTPPDLELPVEPSQEKVFREMKSWLVAVLSGEINNILLLGNAGNGKSHTAFAAARLISDMYLGYNAYYVAMGNLDMGWKANHDRLIFAAQDAFLLILDEVGSTDNPKKEQGILFRIINERWERQLPMILISNQSSEAFKETVGDRLHSRIMANKTLTIECGYINDLRNPNNWQDKGE